MTTDYRAMCAELTTALEYAWDGRRPKVVQELIDRARALLAQPTPQPVVLDDIGLEWRPCVKLPITVHVRDQRPGETHSNTREGITPLRSDDLIMRGVQGEEYPIGRDLFEQTYELLPTPEATHD